MSGGQFSVKAFQGQIGAPEVRPAPGPIEDVSTTLGQARELSLRIQALADRALGPAPEASGADSKLTSRGGVLNAMQEDALTTQGLLADGMRALTRLEQVLS